MAKSRKTSPDKWVTLTAKRLKQLRIAGGYSSYESFALDNGLDRKQYWRVENGANITIRTLVKILDIHQLDLPTFYKDLLKSTR